jgi:hypothetical protein
MCWPFCKYQANLGSCHRTICSGSHPGGPWSVPSFVHSPLIGCVPLRKQDWGTRLSDKDFTSGSAPTRIPPSRKQSGCLAGFIPNRPRPPSGSTRSSPNRLPRKLATLLLDPNLTSACSLFSKLIIYWLSPLLKVGFSRPLEVEGTFFKLSYFSPHLKLGRPMATPTSSVDRLNDRRIRSETIFSLPA